jgi:hypothetical protein
MAVGAVPTLLDSPTCIDLARAALQDEHAQIEGWQVHELHASLGPGARLHRYRGAAETNRIEASWSFVVKSFSPEGEGFRAAGSSADAWDYWKREWHVYRAAWLPRLQGGLVAPRCLGTGEGEGGAWIAMEDLTDYDERPWSLQNFATTARHLGEFNGSYLVGEPIPSESWLPQNWLRGWTARAEPMIRLLPEVADHPLIGRIYPPTAVQEMLQLWSEREVVHDALDWLPQTFCHQDSFPSNVFLRRSAQLEQSVAIDWAFCGQGPVGQDLAPLVAASLHLFQAEGLDPGRLEAQCLQAYLAGLRAAGWSGPEDDVRLGYLGSVVLRYSLGLIGPVLMCLLDEAMHAFLEEAFGHPLDDIVEHYRVAVRLNERWAAQLRQLLASRGAR